VHDRSCLRVFGPASFHHVLDATVVLPPVLAVQPTSLGVRGTGRIGIAQQALDARQDRRNIVDRTPVVLQDVETDLSVAVNVGVEHFGDELHGGGPVRIRFGELQDQAEGPALPGRVIRSKNTRLPREDIVVEGCTRHAARGVMLEPFEIAKKSSACRCTHGKGYISKQIEVKVVVSLSDTKRVRDKT